MAKTTSFILGEHFESFVASQIDAGRYSSASEVIREGLRLVEYRERQVAAMDAAIQIGIDSGVADAFSWDQVKSDGKAIALKSS